MDDAGDQPVDEFSLLELVDPICFAGGVDFSSQQIVIYGSHVTSLSVGGAGEHLAGFQGFKPHVRPNRYVARGVQMRRELDGRFAGSMLHARQRFQAACKTLYDVKGMHINAE